jgi:hypothetical protein
MGYNFEKTVQGDFPSNVCPNQPNLHICVIPTGIMFHRKLTCTIPFSLFGR